MKKPIIGIACGMYTDMSSSGYYSYTYNRLDKNYYLSVIKAGGIPLMIPISSDIEVIEAQVDLLDGIILSGGPDINPLLFNEEPLEKLGTISSERDDFEMKLLECAYKKKKPILGICRGIQIINTFFGGTVLQDISYDTNVKTHIKHDQSTSAGAVTHTINIQKDSFLYKIFGEKVITNSYHHQSVNKAAPDFKVTGTTTDNVIEVIEKIDASDFILGVQFHPEMMAGANNPDGLKIFQALISECINKKMN